MTSFSLFAFCTTLKKLNTLMANIRLVHAHRYNALFVCCQSPHSFFQATATPSKKILMVSEIGVQVAALYYYSNECCIGIGHSHSHTRVCECECKMHVCRMTKLNIILYHSVTVGPVVGQGILIVVVCSCLIGVAIILGMYSLIVRL